jgi:hypothetical protein
MQTQFENAFNTVKELEKINACLAGSSMLGYKEGWNQDIDLFCYDEQSFTALLYFMHYNPMFNILDKLELHKFEDYTRNKKSSLESFGVISIKFMYNLCIPINIVYKKFGTNIFNVLSSFDTDLIAQGYCLQTKQYLSLRKSTGMIVNWNVFNTSFYKSDYWSVKRLLRQFDRNVKYHERGYDLSQVTDKYISIVEEILLTENIYKSEKGNKYFEDTIEQFEVVLKILKVWKRDLSITPEQLLTLKTLI